MVIVPEMIGSVVGVYNGKVFNNVEIKPDMIGTYLGEYSITYRPVAHGRGGQAGVPVQASPRSGGLSGSVTQI